MAWSKPANPVAFACADGGGPSPGSDSLRGRGPSMRDEAAKKKLKIKPKVDLGFWLCFGLENSDIFFDWLHFFCELL